MARGGKGTSYPEDFKRSTIELLLTEEQSIRETAKNIGVHEKTFQLYVYHTDEKREWAYDRKSHIGQLYKGLDYALKNKWKVIYPFEINTKKEI